jgi:hypothetical protein
MNRARAFVGFLVFAALVWCWADNTPYQQVSACIGAHFPWPEAKPWKWPALLVEGALINVVVTLPAALILTLSLRRWALAGALVLCAIFGLETLLTADYASATKLRNGVAFAVYLGICHTLLLVALTLVMRSRSNYRLERP